VQEAVHKQIARITPILQPIQESANSRSPPHNSPSRVIPTIDLSNEDTVSYNEYSDFYEPIEEQYLEPPLQNNNREIISTEHPELIDLSSRSPNNYDNEIRYNVTPELIDLEPNSPDNRNGEVNLEPLNPDAEYQWNIHRMFITLDEYARNAYLTAYNT